MGEKKTIIGPHLRTPLSTRSMMADVAIALTPALLGAIYFFGIRSLWMTLLSAAVCVASEYLWQKLLKKQITAGDFSAVVTGMLIAFNMPVTVPYWIIIVADLFAILVVKQMFGGIGNNFVNPALMGRLLVMIRWPGTLMQYVMPQTVGAGMDAVSTATVLSTMKSGTVGAYTYWQMFIGEMPGAIGETSKLLLLVGFGYMCYKGVVNVSSALTYIATVTVLTFVFSAEGMFAGDILTNLLGGGLIMGGCYMLTDYVFVSRRGKILYALVAGIITAAIRTFSLYPEGICFGILTANCLAGWMAMAYNRHVYGVSKKKA